MFKQFILQTSHILQNYENFWNNFKIVSVFKWCFVFGYTKNVYRLFKIFKQFMYKNVDRKDK